MKFSPKIEIFLQKIEIFVKNLTNSEKYKFCNSLTINSLLDGKELKPNSQILKFEMIQNGNRRSLIVKNVTKSDFCKYTVSCRGEKKEAKLSKKNPFVTSVQNTKGYIGGIAVFQCDVHVGTQVNWYYGNKVINRKNFR